MRIPASALQDARIFTGVSWPWLLRSPSSLHAHLGISAPRARIFAGVSWPRGLGNSTSSHEHLEVSAVSSPEEVFAVYVEGARQRTNVQVLRRRRRDEIVAIISRQRALMLQMAPSEVFVISLFVHNMPLIALIRRFWTFLRS